MTALRAALEKAMAAKQAAVPKADKISPKKGFRANQNSQKNTGKYKHAEPDADETGGTPDGDGDDIRSALKKAMK